MARIQASSQVVGDNRYALTSSFDSFTGSINLASSSFATTTTQLVSASSSFASITDRLSTASSSLGLASSSFASVTDRLSTASSSLGLASASFATSINGINSTFTGSVQSIGDSRYLSASQLGAANGVAQLNASSLVVQNPVNAVAVAATNKIVKSPAGSQYIDLGWIGSGTPTSLNFLRGDGSWQDVSTGQPNSYTKTTFTGQTSVTVEHNFGTYPLVQVLGADGEVIIPQSIINTSINSVTVTFFVSTTGTLLLTLGSPQPSAFKTTAISYSVAATDQIVQATAKLITLTLPTAAGCTGHVFVIDNISAGNVIIATTSSQTIQGSLTQVLGSNCSLSIFSDGSNYRLY